MTTSTKMVREGCSEVSLDLGNERSKGWGLGDGDLLNSRSKNSG